MSIVGKGLTLNPMTWDGIVYDRNKLKHYKTVGWWEQISGTVDNTSTCLELYKSNSANGVASTLKCLRVNDYTKLHAIVSTKATQESYIALSKTFGDTNPTNKFSVKGAGANEKEYEWDISLIGCYYFIAITAGTTNHLKVYKIWLT